MPQYLEISQYFDIRISPISGYFYAPDAPDESVLGMCTNSNNSLLVTGDTQGYIKVWDIMSHCVKSQDDGVSTRDLN